MKNGMWFVMAGCTVLLWTGVSAREVLASPVVLTRANGLVLEGDVNPNDLQSWEFSVRGLDRPESIRLTCDEVGGTRERLQMIAPPSMRPSFTLHGLKADTYYSCFADFPEGNSLKRSNSLSILTDPLPDELKAPRITVPSANPAETGYTLYNYGDMVGTSGPEAGNLVILDAEGNIRWYYAGPGRGDLDASYLGDGQILFGGWSTLFYAPTEVDLDKQTLFQATSMPASPYELVGTYNHDAGLSCDGESIFTFAYTLNNDLWTGFIIKQIDWSNQVVWSWDSVRDGLDAGQLPSFPDDTLDPYHANAIVDRWEDGHYYLYVSLRNISQILKIDYYSKKVLWRLGFGGDFKLLEADGQPAADSRWFFNQHDAKIYGDQVVLYDNGTDRSQFGEENYSRFLQVDVDQENFVARISFEYTEPNWAEPFWGGNDRLPNGHYLGAIGHFWMSDTPDRMSALIELDSQGQIVWRADFTDQSETLYRAERIPGCDIFNNLRYCP